MLKPVRWFLFNNISKQNCSVLKCVEIFKLSLYCVNRPVIGNEDCVQGSIKYAWFPLSTSLIESLLQRSTVLNYQSTVTKLLANTGHLARTQLFVGIQTSKYFLWFKKGKLQRIFLVISAKVVMSVGECTMAVPGEEMDGTGELTRACLMLLQQIFTLDCDNLI